MMVHTLYVPSEMKQSSSAGDESKARDAACGLINGKVWSNDFSSRDKTETNDNDDDFSS